MCVCVCVCVCTVHFSRGEMILQIMMRRLHRHFKTDQSIDRMRQKNWERPKMRVKENNGRGECLSHRAACALQQLSDHQLWYRAGAASVWAVCDGLAPRLAFGPTSDWSKPKTLLRPATLTPVPQNVVPQQPPANTTTMPTPHRTTPHIHHSLTAR